MTATEVEFCDRLRDWAERLGFEVYPEVHGWDLVLVSDKPRTFRLREWPHDGRDRWTVQPGEQVGIHAKLRANCDVLVQACVNDPTWRYPRYPFVACPEAGSSFRYVARRLGVGVIVGDDQRSRRKSWGQAKDVVDPTVKDWPASHSNPVLDLPPVASRAIVAGAPSPRVLSSWRVKALRFLMEVRAQPERTFTVATLLGFGLSKSWVERWGEPVDWTEDVRRGKRVRVRVYRLTEVAERLPDWGYRDVAAEMAAKEPAA